MCIYVYINIKKSRALASPKKKKKKTVVGKKRHDTAASNASACTQQRFACSENVPVADSGTKLIGV